MLKIIGQKIILTRGDTANIELAVYKDSNERYILTGRDKVYLTVKDSYSDANFKFQKTADYANVLDNGNIYIKINPSDTNSLEIKDYVYDVELKTANGDVYTIIAPSGNNIPTFTIAEEATYPNNEG